MKLKRQLIFILSTLVMFFVLYMQPCYLHAEQMYVNENGDVVWGHPDDKDPEPDDDKENNENNENDENGDTPSSDDGGNSDNPPDSENPPPPPPEDPRVKALQEEIDKLYAECGELYKANNGMSAELYKKIDEIAERSKELAKAKEDAEAREEARRRKMAEELAEQEAMAAGDPVLITNGSYDQNETDITLGGLYKFEVTRRYNSASRIISSFGYGWSTNLDQRVIYGTDGNAVSIYEKICSNAQTVKNIYDELELKIKENYSVTDLMNGESEIRERIAKAEEIKNRALEICSGSDEDESGGSGTLQAASDGKTSESNLSQDKNDEGEDDESDNYGSGSYGSMETESSLDSSKENESHENEDEEDETSGTGSNYGSVETDKSSYASMEDIKEAAADLVQEAEEKISALNEDLNHYLSDVASLLEIKGEYERLIGEAEEYRIKAELSQARKQRNQKVIFSGMDSAYDETGFDTITIIDENGYPHLLYENNGIWKNDKDLSFGFVTYCEGFVTSLVLTQKDGTKKTFDDAGFIVLITDRNGNFVQIQRDSNEKITKITDSTGETFKVSYSGKYISKIENERDSDENVIYNYNGNRLVGVKDTDGDSVSMSYDLNGRMTSLNKCDGSSVLFEYGEQTADGLVLTTTTTNEEGFSERFEYYRSQKRTDYIDHDGNKTCYWYDEKQRTVREVRPDGTDIRNEYDAYGNLVSVNENGNITFFSYDSVGYKTGAAYSDGSSESWSYDSFGLVTSHTDRDGVHEVFERDSKGKLISYSLGGRTAYTQQFDSRGLVTRRTVYGENSVITDFEYDDFGNLISETCGGVKTEYEYDSHNRVTAIASGGKVLRQYEYDGHKTLFRDWNGLETTFLANGRKDLVEIYQKDTVTGIVRKSRIEYDRRHLPLKVYEGDGETEKLTSSYIYTAEGKLRAEILHGEENWIREYEYKNGQILEIKQYKENGNPDEVYSQKYDYQLQNANKKLLSVTDALGYVSLFEYDSYGNLVKATDSNGEITQRRYTKSGLLSAAQSEYGGWYEYGYTNGVISSAKEQGGAAARAEYFADGNLKSETDRYGKVTYYHYDNRERVSSVQSEAQKVWYEYDDYGRVTRQIIGNSPNVTSSVYYATYEYSENGRSVIVTEGGKYKTVYELDAFGNVIKQIDGNNNERSFVYDYRNQLTESYDGYGNKTSYEYNALGQVSKVTQPDGSITKYKYNYMGLLTKVSDDCGVVYTAAYDKAGRLIKERNRADSEKSYEYDRGGRITKVLCGGEAIESYTYGANSRTITVKDGNGENYIYNYDGFGRLVNEKNRNGLEQNYFYDEDGKLKSKNSFDGGTTTISYSSDRTVRTVTYSDGSQNRFIYDAVGNIVEAQNAYGKTQYGYDQDGRMIYQKDVTTGEEIYFSYDDVGNRIRLESSNRQTSYTYGKNNEIKEIFDNKQRISIILEYDKVGREVLRKFGNGTKEETLYDKAGRVTVKTQKNDRGDLLWGEGYVYGDNGKRTATVDNLGRITFYEYNNKGQLSSVYYPYTQEMINNLKEEAETNGLSVTAETGENRFLTSAEKSRLVPLLNSMQYGLAYNLTNMQVLIKESYVYDRNGNRIGKTTPYGTIEYTYDRENCLLSSGSKGKYFINYTYDAMGNLLTEESTNKIVKYAYNAQNRLIYCEVTDRANKEYAQTTYAYDAFGRRIIVQDKNEAALRTLYDGLTFDVIKQSSTFENGLFTDSQNTGIKFGSTGRPTGDRYRYLGDEDLKDNNRYFYLDENTYKTVNCRYRGERTTINVNGTLAAQTTDEGTDYFVIDFLGSVASITDTYGSQKTSYTYDAFGTLVQGNLTGTTDFGYLSKQQDPTSHLYNYGYRDYKPQTARFTTIDPIRDGYNWMTYCNNDAINFVDLWGLCQGSDNNVLDSLRRMEEISKLIENANANGANMNLEQLAKSLGLENDYNKAIFQQKETEKFSNLMRETVGAKYGHTRMPTENEMDCSGGFVYVADKMGYKVDLHTTANGMASGKTPGIVMYKEVSNDRQGIPGVVNFYDWEQDGYIDHINYGVGKKRGENSNQIIDASEGKTWQAERNKSPEQTPKAEEDKINKTWSPFSNNTTPTKQGFIDFTQMERK